MNGAHWHLIVNHLPIVFPIVGIIVMITGQISKSEAVRRTALMIFVIGALTTFPAMATGERAEDVVEKLTDVAQSYIENHEEAAEKFALLSYILGALSLAGLWASFKQKSFSGIISTIVFLLALVVVFFARHAGTTGGEIRHPEIRSDFHLPAPEYEQEKHMDND